ncbi:MAG: B12-binding domain-containing radical SAM protein [Bacillota bacterium]|nr:B12-binding domain-containing radical SAM protein [Bacillota bacterium]
MKRLLVGINSKFIHSNLAIRYLSAYTKDLKYNIKVNEYTINDSMENILRGILEEEPDLVCFSTYIWNTEIIKKLAGLIKAVSEKVKILYGGPEVSFDGKEFLEKNEGEYIIEGEGEETFREFIIALHNKKPLVGIKGLYYKEKGSIRYNGKRGNMDMNQVIFPYEENENFDNKIVYYEASRGCPYRCKYCLSSVDRNTRFLNIERVKKDLKYFVDKKVKLVKFVDRTFNINKEFTSDIWEYLIGLGGDTCFHFEISAKLLNDDQIEILKKAPAGKFQFEVGVQTTNEEVLKNINRAGSFSEIKEKVIKVQELKSIKQHLDLIAGLPGEDYESFINSFNQVYCLRGEELQLGFLKLLKGSLMYEEIDYWGIKYSPYPPYEVLKTKDISYFQLQKLKKVEKLVDKYYNSNKFILILEYLINKFDSPYDFYYRLSLYFTKMGYYERPLSNDNYYKALIDFYISEKGQKDSWFSEILKFEYLKYNKKRGIPDFLKKKIDKEEYNKIKELVLSAGLNIDKDSIYIEKFSINILNYIKSKEMIKEICYGIFNIKDEEDIHFFAGNNII